MRSIIFILFFNTCFYSLSQGFNIKQKDEALWDQGVPLLPQDPSLSKMIEKITFDSLTSQKFKVDKKQAKILREIGIAFYDRGMYDAAEWYLEKAKGYKEIIEVDPEVILKSKEESEKEEDIPESISESLEADKKFLENLPETYENIPPSDMKKLAVQIENQIQKLIKEKEDLIKNNAKQEVIEEKSSSIKSLEKEKDIINLNIETVDLKKDKKILNLEISDLRKYLIWAGIILLLLTLGIIALLQRKIIRVQDKEILQQLSDINKKNTYLEYAARIIRHDMHSGINTYMPRGLSSLQKRITPEIISDLKIGPSIQMIQEGLLHTQKVYKNVYEFTNLVKVKSDFNKTEINLKNSIEKYLSNTSYYKQVEIEDLDTIIANEQLFCNAIDNLIKNGLKYNESKNKIVKIYREDDNIIVEDNGVGLSSKKFEEYIKRGVDLESETGLGLGIAKAIIEEHNFKLYCEEIKSGGTKLKIKINND
jgi:signal transduction histidine kinase